MTPLYGTPIHLSDALPDGQVWGTPHGIIIGTRPLTDLEYAGAEGRYIVRRGLADVLEYIDEQVGPAPVQSGRGEAILQQLKKIATRYTPLAVPYMDGQP